MVAKKQTKQKQKEQKAQKSQFDLPSIEAICGHLGGIQFHVALDWRNNFNLPIQRVNGVWKSNKEDINHWCQQRDISDPQKVSQHYLETYVLRVREKAGKLTKINRKLKGINEITSFCGQSLPTVYSWQKDWKNFPAKKENNEFVADCDELLSWLIKNDLITMHIAFEKAALWSARDNYV